MLIHKLPNTYIEHTFYFHRVNLKINIYFTLIIGGNVRILRLIFNISVPSLNLKPGKTKPHTVLLVHMTP